MSGAAAPSAAAPNHPPPAAAVAAAAVERADADADDADDSALTPDSPQWRAHKWLCDIGALPPRAAGQLMRRATALAEVHDNDNGNGKGVGAGDTKTDTSVAVAAEARAPAAVTAAASRSSEWYVDVCVSDAVSWRTPWSVESVAPGAVFQRMCNAFGYADAHTDVETVQWIVRALLCMRLVWTPPSASGVDAKAAVAGPPEWPAVVAGERDASIFTLHTVCVPHDSPVRSSSGEVQYQYASPIVCAALTREPLVCTALLDLPAHCGLDVSVLDPADGAAVWWACVVDPNVSLAARLLRASSDAALNAHARAPNHTPCSLLHGAVTSLLLQRNAKSAEVVVLCCDAAVSRSDGSGVDLFAPFRHDPKALMDDPRARTDEELRAIAAAEHATADRALTALERVTMAVAQCGAAAPDRHVAAALAALCAATSRVTAYATGVQRALADAFASPSASASASSTHLPLPLQGIVLDYALHRRAESVPRARA